MKEKKRGTVFLDSETLEPVAAPEAAAKPAVNARPEYSPEDAEELKGKLVLGILHQTQYKEFTYAYDELIKKLYKEREDNE